MNFLSFGKKTNNLTKALQRDETKAYKKAFASQRLSAIRKEAREDAKYGSRAVRVVSTGIAKLNSPSRKLRGKINYGSASRPNVWR